MPRLPKVEGRGVTPMLKIDLAETSTYFRREDLPRITYLPTLKLPNIAAAVIY